MTCDHTPAGMEMFTEPGQFFTSRHPGMTHAAITVRGGQGGTASDGTPGKKPDTVTMLVLAGQLPDVVVVEPGRGGRGAPRHLGQVHGGRGAGSVVRNGGTVSAAPPASSRPENRMPDGEDGVVLIAVYDCGCTPAPTS